MIVVVETQRTAPSQATPTEETPLHDSTSKGLSAPVFILLVVLIAGTAIGLFKYLQSFQSSPPAILPTGDMERKILHLECDKKQIWVTGQEFGTQISFSIPQNCLDICSFSTRPNFITYTGSRCSWK